MYRVRKESEFLIFEYISFPTEVIKAHAARAAMEVEDDNEEALWLCTSGSRPVFLTRRESMFHGLALSVFHH